MGNKWIEAMQAAGMLFPPFKIGDELYAVGDLGEPYIESYTVAAVMFDGERWYASDDMSTWNEYGTDEAITSANEAIAKFSKIRNEWMEAHKND